MIKQKLSKIICASLLVSSIISTGVLAAERQDYIAYKIPAMHGNNYTGIHQKETKKDYITNHVTAMTNVSTVTFWAVNGNYEQISNDYDQKVGNQSNLIFTSTGYDKKGVEVGMGMENADTSLDTGFVSGWVNFH